MSRVRIPVSHVLLWAIIGLGIGYFYWELRQTEADLRQTQQALAQSNANLTAGVEARNALVDDVNTLVVQRDVLVAERNALFEERYTLYNRVRELSQANRSLVQEKNVLTQEYDQLTTTHEELDAAHEELGAAHEALQASHLGLQTSHETLQTSHKALQGLHTTLNTQYRNLDRNHTELQQAVGTVEGLETQAGSLRTEIAKLEERRRPLILDEHSIRRSGALCTGSMEPTLTCLDERSWLMDFRSEDIVVGTIIIFNPNCWEDEADDRWTSHRVKEIEVRDGVRYYWPKGDGNREADGCWVPEHHVRGYLIEVHKNARPENATLRNNVKAAKAAYLAAMDDYRDLREFYGCYDFTVTCVVYSDFAYNELSRAYDIYEQAYDNYWNCWYRNAEDSEYPGHIPYTC